MDRQQTFQRLKPSCVEILQLVASLPQTSDARKELVQALSRLLQALQDITARPASLDARLAEYAFVPISQVLRISRTVPVRVLELCLECISILLGAGWGGDLAPDLSGQLLILFTFMAKPSSAENGLLASSEELQTVSFKCMAELFTEVSRTLQGRQYLTATANIPALGEAVLITLEGITESNSNDLRLQALAGLEALVFAIDDRDALASFLPRITSSLTKILTPSGSHRVSFRVLERSLTIMSALFLRLLSDRETKSLPSQSSVEGAQNAGKVVRSASWLQATASQVRIALANIFRLRGHDKVEVRQSLLQLCLTIVQECRESLSGCIGMAIETMITLSGRNGTHDTIETDLRVLITSDSRLSTLLRESLRGWVISLPRLMQSKDDMTRRGIIHQISVALRLLNEEQNTIDDLLAENIRDSVSSVFADSRHLESITETTIRTALQTELDLSRSNSTSFQPLRLRLKGQDDLMTDFKLLIRDLAKSKSGLTVAQSLIQAIDFGSQETKLASFWVSINLLKDLMRESPSIDDFLDLETSDLQTELLDDLYSHSLAILSQEEFDKNTHWHFQILALETIALQAERYKSEFRAELNETLYPVLHYLGSSNAVLRDHAITCLNILAESCEYRSASDLIVSNVDYIINAVGLRLNYDDVSPQAPQVLLMAMRLCGPQLLPYLDDLVDSMFGTLERFHGYPKLVELLFSVLKGMAEEGMKTSQLAINAEENTLEENINKRITIGDVIQTVKRLEEDSRKQDEEHRQIVTGSFPHEPWKDDTMERDPGEEDISNMDKHQADNAQTSEPLPPVPTTYNILLKISELTQHYLTSSSPRLRTSLVSLLQTTIPALAKHTDSFLPLINTLWPVLQPRLNDPEAYVISNALDTIAMMCVHAQDFMKSRIEEAWDDFKFIHQQTLKQAGNHNKGNPKTIRFSTLQMETSMKDLSIRPELKSYRPEIYVDTPTRMIWDSLVRLFCAVSRHVSIREEHFDDVLEILDPVLEQDDVRKALHCRNEDAVWLHLYKKSRREVKEKSFSCENPSESLVQSKTVPMGKPQ